MQCLSGFIYSLQNAKKIKISEKKLSGGKPLPKVFLNFLNHFCKIIV